MKLWFVEPIGGENAKGAWHPWYDKCFGMVIRAEDENHARVLAHSNACAENREDANNPSPWLDPKQTVCSELSTDEAEGVIIRNVSWA